MNVYMEMRNSLPNVPSMCILLPVNINLQCKWLGTMTIFYIIKYTVRLSKCYMKSGKQPTLGGHLKSKPTQYQCQQKSIANGAQLNKLRIMVTKGAEGNIYLTLAISVGSRKVNRESLQPRSSQSSLKRRNQKQPKLATDQIIKSSLEFSVFILSKLSLQFSRKKEEKETEPKSHAKRNGITKEGGAYRRKSSEKKKSQIQRKE